MTTASPEICQPQWVPTKSEMAATACVVVALLLCLCSGANAEESSPVTASAADRLFTLKVLPLLKEKCFGCHGGNAEDIRGAYDLTNRERLLKGGESGDAAIVPGNADDSLLYQAVMWDGYEMPPKENDRLTPQQTDIIRQWINSGAPWPDKATQAAIQKEEWAVLSSDEGIIVATSGGLADDWTYRRYQPEDIWAFRPVQKPAIPQAEASSPVDYFINHRLQENELTAAGSADAQILIRRATLDLTGLPPTLAEVNAFAEAWNQDRHQAWQALIDRLLDSPHYGERWAQHWLDVVRYADTSGFSNDYERSNAWRYRDYVIRSLNSDKPYDEFIKEQIAGDEMRPDDPEAIIATGLLRMGPWGTAMVPKEEARQIYLDDLVHNVGQTFLSMPMRCCKCHDHKFDPLPTRDYYRLYAAFATTQPAEVPADFLPTENRSGFEDSQRVAQELLDFATAEFDRVYNKQEAAARQWYAEHNLPYKDENARQKDPEDQKPPRHVGLDPEETGVYKVRRQDVWIWTRRMERYQPLAQSVFNGPPGRPNSRKLRAPKQVDTKWSPVNHILTGGALDAPQDVVSPGVLSAAGVPVSDGGDDPWKISDGISGRRLQLARWIAHPDNPLSTRSIVNRVWQYHFGTGIVKTANNFGAKGGQPSHPELLDWLTADFVEHGWKLKRLHRLIMLSDAYQRSARPADAERQAAADPDNRLLASFPTRRLTAEELRDSILAVTGELNPEMGGIPIMPEMNMEVALQPRMIQFSIAPAYQPSRTPDQRNRRTIYVYRVRGQADPFLEIMNLPNPNESCELRDSASVSPQAFTLLNSDVMTDRSIAFALRVRQECEDESRVSDWVRQAIQLAYSRPARNTEVSNLTGYLKEMQQYHADHRPQQKEYPRQVVRSLVEELTGKPFEFVERLNVYDDYVADAKPWTVDADTRALADVCLLLLNSNEFLYVN